MTVFFFDLILFIIEFWLHHVLLNLKFKLKFRISQFLLWILIHPLSTSLRPPPSRVASWVWKVHSRVGCRRLVYFLSLQDSKLSKGTCSLSHLLFSFLFFFFFTFGLESLYQLSLVLWLTISESHQPTNPLVTHSSQLLLLVDRDLSQRFQPPISTCLFFNCRHVTHASSTSSTSPSLELWITQRLQGLARRL